MASYLRIDYAQAESSINEMKSINYQINNVHSEIGATMNVLSQLWLTSLLIR